MLVCRGTGKQVIVSASRRTDIPAFQGRALSGYISRGFADTVNPYNSRQVRRVSLLPEDVDALVLWTKNGIPFVPYVDSLAPYAWYLQYTINGYGDAVEPNIPRWEAAADNFCEFSDRFGRERMVWRYDPVCISSEFTVSYHCKRFSVLARRIASSAALCVLSFLDMYRRNAKGCAVAGIRPPDEGEVRELAGAFAGTAGELGLELETCAEPYDLLEFGIRPGACVDSRRIAMISGKEISAPAAGRQREYCRCVKSVDIGSYGTCRGGCVYCYARGSRG